MKLALPVFLLSIAAYLGTVAATRLPKLDSEFDTPLDASDARRVEIHSGFGVRLHFSESEKPRVTADNDGGTRVVVNRNGDRMVIRTHIKSYDDIDVYLPPSVEHLVLDADTDVLVDPKLALGAVQVESLQGLDWNGAAESLRVRLDRPASCLLVCTCRANVSVVGKIGSLHIRSTRGDVNLVEPESMGTVEVVLGPEATVSINDSRDPGRVRVTDLQGRSLGTGPLPSAQAADCKAKAESQAQAIERAQRPPTLGGAP